MGAFDWIGQVGDWFKNRWNEDWSDFGKTFTESWKAVPKQMEGVGAGIVGMASAPFDDDVEFWGSARLWIDSFVGSASAVLGGTVGTLFQVPVLHEASWLLDKAYRYGIARPIATSFLMSSNTNRAAYASGRVGFGDIAEQLFNFNTLKKAWNDSEYVTPGQAIVYNASLSTQSVFDVDDAFKWAEENDPRTLAGQAKFNSPEANFWLKYSSGTLDFAGNVFADPGHGASALYKAGKLRLVDKVATTSYVMQGKVHAEVGSNPYEKTRQFALQSETPEQFGDVALPTHRFRGQVQTLLWSSARMGEEIYRDTYLTLRAFDVDAFKRLADSAPKIAADFADMFANHTIADYDFQRGQLASETMGADALRKTTVDAFIDSFAGGEGIWGSALGKGVGEAMPRIRAVSKIRAGYHSKILSSRPIIVAAARPLANLMPSQGWSPRIDPMDGTGLGLRQFRANLERTNVLTPDELNRAVSRYGAATSDAVRQTTAMRIENVIIARMLKDYGLTQRDLNGVLNELNAWRSGSRKLWGYERRFISEEAAKRAEQVTAYGRDEDAVKLHMFSDEYKKAVAAGEAVDSYVAQTDVDGRVNLIPVVKRDEPILRSQFTDAISMLDYRALSGALRWWNLTHPKSKKMPDPDDPSKTISVDPSNWRLGFAKLAKLRGFYDATIGVLDAASVLWKATALMRPAQAPRNVADDVLRSYIEFGKMPMLLAASDAVPNAMRNFWGRGKLFIEHVQDKLVKQRATGQRPVIDGDVVGGTADNVDLTDPAQPVKYFTPAAAFADGAISLDTYFEMLKAQLDTPLGLGPKFGVPRFEEPKIETPLFQPRATAAEREAMGVKGAGAAVTPKKRPPRQKEPRYSEVPGRAETPYLIPHAGPPHLMESVLIRRYQNGEMSLDDLKMNLAYQALTRFGRAKFDSVKWGMDLVKDVVTKHLNRRQTEEYLDDPYGPGTVVVDPFTGMQPKKLTKRIRDNFDVSSEAVVFTRNVKGRLGQRAGTIKSVALGEVASQLRKWVAFNVDELLKPDVLLSLRVKPDGNLAIGFARVKKDVAAKETVKVGARQRLRNFHETEIRDIAHTGFDVRLRNGQTISFGGVFDGDVGQQMQKRISARTNPSVSYGSLISDTNVHAGLEDEGSWVRPMTAVDPEYGQNWERAVNAQIASDPVARLFLQGKTDAEVIDAVETSAWGAKWVRAMNFRAIAYVDQIRQIGAMVEAYVPSRILDDTKTNAVAALRQAVLEKKATFKEFEALYKDDTGKVDTDAMPEIHGLSVEHVLGNSRVWKTFRNLMRNTQKIISDMPVDKVARFPFMAMSYKQHGTALTKIANEYFENGPVPANVISHIKDVARERAYHDTRYRLYDTAQRNDFANATRFLMPFSAAMMDSYIKYGRNIRQNPMLLVQGAYYWTMFERNMMVQDENGYVAQEENGKTAWYQVDPQTGEKTRVADELVGKHKYVQFQMPTALAKTLGMDTPKYYGVEGKTVLAVNKDTMNVFLNLPGAGPLVALPASEFALDNPEFAEHELVKKYILPFGANASWTKVALPSTVRSAWDAFMAEDGDTASGHAAAIMQAELTAFALGTRNAPPTFEEVRERAAGMMYLRAASTYLSPASFQMVSPYQPYVDAYRQLLQKDPATAAEEFMRRYGDEFYAMTMSVTRNVAGITASLNSHKQYQKYKELISDYPEFGGLIVGAEGAGPFAKAVYEAQKETPVSPGSSETLRSLMSLTESVSNLHEKTVWAKYSKMMALVNSAMVDRGISSLQSRAARDLKAQVDAFVEANRTWVDPNTGREELSPWYRDFKSSDRGKAEYRLHAMRRIVQDPGLQQRDDIRGLAEYLSMRDDMRRAMARYGYKSLDSQKARHLQRRWEQQVHSLVEANDAFSDLWSRWLSQDNKLDLA